MTLAGPGRLDDGEFSLRMLEAFPGDPAVGWPPAYRFERECRTAYSEAYTILQEDRPIGRVDLHFTPTVVQGALSISEVLTEEEVEDLIEVVDEELVMTADTPREDFIITVYQGRSLGTYSDEDFQEDDEQDRPDEANGR